MADSEQPTNFGGLRVAAFESRFAPEMARLIEKSGGQPLVAPSMREIPLEENPAALAFAEKLFAGQCDVLILLTGVGTRTLVEAIETRYPREKILEGLRRVLLVARGPKPVAALRSFGITPQVIVPEPNTWRQILQALDGAIPLPGQQVAVQEYGIPNREFLAGLAGRGANVMRVPVYKWALPEDLGPLRNAIQEISAGNVHVVLFTNAQQVQHLLQVAGKEGVIEGLRRGVARTVICSIGPVASEALEKQGFLVDFEPEHSKMGIFVKEAARMSRNLVASKRRPVITIETPAAAADRLRDSLFLRACRLEPTERTPVWLMRQAGRYMKEYRDLRERVGFLDLCKNSELAAEITVSAVQRLGVDAAILFADLLLVVEPMGFELEYSKGEGPIIHNPARTAADVDRVRAADPADLGYVYESVRKVRAALPAHLPLIGFVGAPFTLASYLVEGEGTRNAVLTKSLMYRDPGAWRAMMEKLVTSLAGYANGQVAAGAQAIQIFDSWVGCLSPRDYRDYVLPFTQSLIRQISAVPVIHFGTGTATLLELMKEAGGQVIGLDWRVNLDEAWARLGKVAIMGNFDPVTLFADAKIIRSQVERILAQAGGRPGHIFNLGHGILPGTPVENVIALVEAVKELSCRSTEA
ncbi:MAG: uroporphyrinogen decarboxylase [Candidatus Tectomicrobia bacterium]|uniref:Uroporphyrinogen decarboxylase n=1 Tax=Tectimicrobiota bacterium TaxID=2528274 RepID=A0A932GR45_UNCTE|nr:uroporphyrinogen decarboxylase [Candidatus Tectomicrobia bacterium]